MDPTLYGRWKRHLPSFESITHNKPLVIGVAGGPCSGKTEFCNAVVDMVSKEAPDLKVAVISQNQFYHKDLKVDDDDIGLPNYDRPEAFDEKLFHDTLQALRKGKSICIPASEITHPDSSNRRYSDTSIAADVDIVLVKGIFPWFWKPEDFQVKVFLSLDSDIRLSERVLRDSKRGRDLSEVLDYYFAYSKRGFDQYTFPLSYTADIIVPNGRECKVSAHLIGSYIKGHLSKKPEQPMGQKTSYAVH